MHLSPAQPCPGFGSNSQEKHMSQAHTLLANSSPEQQSRNEQVTVSELESQHVSNKIASPVQNESNSSNYSVLKAHLHSPEYSHKRQLPGNMSISQADNISNAISTRQLQSLPSNHHQSHLSTPHQPNQARPFNVSSSHLPATQIASPPRQTALLHIRQNIPRQTAPRQPFTGGGHLQNAQSAQQRMPRQQQMPQQQHQNLMNSHSANAANMFPSNNMTTPTIKPHSKSPATSQMQVAVSIPGQVSQSSAPVGNNNSGGCRVLQHQGHQPVYLQGTAQLKQEGDSNERMPQEPHQHQYGFEGGRMYYDEKDADENMDGIDEEGMECGEFPDRQGFGCPSSDSEEESALLDELRSCEDEERHDEIVSRLQQKGIDPSEIEEMLYHSNCSPVMYPGRNFNEDGDGGAAEGAVSSSSQRQTHFMQNEMRPQAFPAGGQHQPRVYSTPPSGQNKKDTSSAHSSLYDQQSATVSSVGYTNQDNSQAAALVSTDGAVQQGKTSGPQTSDSCLSVGVQIDTQGEVLSIQQQQQQSKQLSLALVSQQKSVSQGSTLETCQSTFVAPQANNWPPNQNAIRAQIQVKPADPRQSSPKGIPQPSQPQCLRPGLINKAPQPHSQAQGQTGPARPQGIAQSSPSGVVERPVQHLTIITSNNQPSFSGQVTPNRFVVRQAIPAQQFVIGSIPQSQQSGFVGTSALSPVKTTCLRLPLQTRQKTPEQQGMPEIHVMTPGQQQGVNRSATAVPLSVPHQLNKIHSPQPRAVLSKGTAPCKASLARLNVMYMQQSLDQEILAKKGTQTAQEQSVGALNFSNSDIIPHNRLPPLHNLTQLPVQAGQLFLQKQQSQSFAVYQPKHQLPPRQPIPAIVNPNSSTNQTFSSGRPICSVVPFTSQNRGQAVSPNILRQNNAQQNANFVRPRNPTALSAQNVGSSSQHVGGNPQISCNPQHAGGNPQQVCGNPQQVAGNPQQVGGNPQQVSGNPQQVGGNPQQVGGNPQQVSGNPQQIGGNPQQVGGNPQHVGGNPQHVGGNPQLVGGNQQLVGGNLQLVGGNQQLVGGNQQLVGGNQQLVGGNQQLVGGNQQLVVGNQQLVGGNQQLVSGNLQIVGGNLQLVGGNPQHVGSNQHLGGNPQHVGSNNQHIGSSPQHVGGNPHLGVGTVSQLSPGTLQNRMSLPFVTYASTLLPVRSPTQGNAVFLTQGNTAPPPAQGNIAPLVPQQLMPDQMQQPQVSNIKSEAFGLEQLSEDKYAITGKARQQLTVNMVYQIRSSKDNSLTLALWNGESFEELKQSDMKASGQPGQIAAAGSLQGRKPVCDALKVPPVQHGQALMTSDMDRQTLGVSALPGVGSKFQTELMLAVNQKSHTDEQSYSDISTEPPPYLAHSSSHEPGDSSALRLQIQPAEVSSKLTYVKPLPQGELAQTQHKPEPMEEQDDEFIFKKPFNENEDYFRVCQYCGYTSKNFKRCEGCKRVFQGEVKIHSLKKQPAKTILSAAGPVNSSQSPKPVESAAKENVRKKGQNTRNASVNGSPRGKGRGRGDRSGRTKGGGLRGRMGVRGKSGEASEDSGTDDSLLGKKRRSDGSGSSSDGSGKKRPARPRAKNATPRKRSKKSNEPVTVTISSDEDEPSSTSSHMANHTASPAGSAGSESPLFPSTPAEPVNAFGRFRRVLMEDEDGQSKLSKKIQQQVVAPMMGRFEDDDDDEDDDEDEPPTYEIDIRSVRIGSMRTQPDGPLLINLQGVCFKVRSERTDEAFECEILAQDVEKVKFFSGQTQPVLFLFLTPESGDILRNICHMSPGDDEYFDPSSTDMKQKMVVIIIECFNYMPNEMLRETLSLWADVNHVEDESFIEELTEESANDLLIQSAPAVLTADVERDIVKFKRRYIRDANSMSSLAKVRGSPSDSTDNEPDSTSSSPPDVRFLGNSVRLLLYPPPPARGLPITTEDLFCLTEGEFLNDVIIDFYLQYLYQEKLSEENRKRTHIFSSFFYKRLTQRDRHSEKTQEDAKKSLPERRHARVKKWTKTVDLFSKDFIVVPINEHSHWYLAVICFPGLANSEVVPFIPSNASKVEFDDESNDNTGEEKPVEDNSNTDSLSRTILGRQLDAKQCLDNEDSKYNLGQKQPCILMFDSLAGPSRTPNVKMLREYLQCEWNAKKSEPRNISKIVRGSSPKVPQQSNYSDCGVYLLQYVESFFEDPIADFQIPMKGLQKWFPEEVVHNKRKEIHELIMNLHQRYQEGRGDPQILDIKFEPAPREQLMKFHPNPEMYAGFSRDDESSNSSVSGEMSRAELMSAAMGMDNSSSAHPQGQFGHQLGADRHQDVQGGSEDQDANENDNTSENHRVSGVQPRE